MADELQNMTLSERLKKADYLTRELSEHLRQGCIPKLSTMIRASRESDAAVVSDQQILDHTLGVLEANDFADGLYKQLRDCLDSIRHEMQPLLFARESPSSSGLKEIVDMDSQITTE